MKDKTIPNKAAEVEETGRGGRLSPLELIKIHGGRAHRVGGTVGRGADSMIAVYKDRFTYTFIMHKEVASIHFDRRRQKIFFRGHNIQNMTITEDHKRELFNLIKVLESDSEGRELKSAYEATLGSQLADNK